MRGRLLIAALVTNIALSVVALGWLAWIAADPSYWFPGAYAEKGERGIGDRAGQSGRRARPARLVSMPLTPSIPSPQTFKT